MASPQLHNVTIYVERSGMARARDFYRALFAGEPVWEEPGHLCCFGTSTLAVCVHEEEAGHRAGTRELFFWTDDLDRVAAQLDTAGAALRWQERADGESELHCVDPEGNLVRLHVRGG